METPSKPQQPPSADAQNEVVLSFVIAAYNAQETIAHCLNSITAQGIEEVEVICIDDGSTDRTAAVIAAMRDKDCRIQLISQHSNQGAPAARNIGLQQTRGRFVAFMDADDELVPQSLTALLDQLLQSGCDAIKGTMLVKVGNRALEEHKLNQTTKYPSTDLASCPDIQHLYQYTTYLFRRSLLIDRALCFDESLSNFQDPEFMSRVLPHCKTICVTLIPVYIRHIRQGSIISSTWGYRNYLSLATGASKVLENLRAAGLETVEPTLATYITWWYKFEPMTSVLSRDECLEIYDAMQPVSREISLQVSIYGVAKAGALHALQLIQQGDYAKCYKLMAQSSRLSRHLPRPAIKLYELFALLIFRMANGWLIKS